MKMRYNFDETLKANVRKYIDIRNKGYYADATALTNDYNKVMGTKRSVTHCGSCLRNMVNELETALKAYEAWEAQEALKALGGYKSAEDKKQAELSGFTSPDEFYAELAMLKEQMEEVAQEIGLRPAGSDDDSDTGKTGEQAEELTTDAAQQTPAKEEAPDDTPAKVEEAEDLTIDFVEEPEEKPSKNSGKK